MNIRQLGMLSLVLAVSILSSCEKKKPVPDVVANYDYLITGKWTEIRRVEKTYNDSVVKRIDSLSYQKGYSSVDFQSGTATFKLDKETTVKKYNFDGSNLTVYYQSPSEETAITYNTTFHLDTMIAISNTITSDGIQYYKFQTKITYVR